MLVGVSVNNNKSVSKNGRFFMHLGLRKYFCQLCGKRKNVTLFLLDVFLHPNVLHELTIL